MKFTFSILLPLFFSSLLLKNGARCNPVQVLDGQPLVLSKRGGSLGCFKDVASSSAPIELSSAELEWHGPQVDWNRVNDEIIRTEYFHTRLRIHEDPVTGRTKAEIDTTAPHDPFMRSFFRIDLSDPKSIKRAKSRDNKPPKWHQYTPFSEDHSHFTQEVVQYSMPNKGRQLWLKTTLKSAPIEDQGPFYARIPEEYL
ncbi:hypothetical protein IE53DRAFT_410448 [Violaceomyces palustris]|uniref:Uncharacterized protein n=1 Tax=Violaceomyces palustris TaxID=1673888 RepID=A0ACD0NYT9_9BASI|nr:hypothetical protein IE53DRAFT_410448 [Violaceomyces palustris]